ncbi:MAG TPA: sulfite exporter TauE/SafE family protein [Gammaproteobacteria bacterium]|nr:sulfite exporter TauE/SafE family protein [Gammaproteobacteria bacterium]
MIAEMFSVLAEIDGAQLAVIAVLTFAGSVAAGLSGMGGGILIAIAITPVIGVKALIPTIAVTMMINHVARVWVFRQGVQWPPATAVLVTALPTTIVGSMVYVSMPPRAIAVVMGVFLIVFVPLRRYLARRAWRVGHAGLAGIGSVYGFLSGTTLGGGMLVIPALLGNGLVGTALIGTDAVIGLTILTTKVAAFGTMELLTPQLAVIGVLVGVVSVPGIYLARWMLDHTAVHLHTLIVEVLILGGGLSFLWRGIAN